MEFLELRRKRMTKFVEKKKEDEEEKI